MRTFAILSTLALASTTALASTGLHEHHAHELAARHAVAEEAFDGVLGDLGERDEFGWEDMSHGLMMEREATEEELAKRDLDGKRGLGQTAYEFPINERGEVQIPRSWEEVKEAAKVVKRKTFTYALSTITWYTKHDLQAPACWNKSRWTPTDKSLICAVTEVWSGKPKCGTWLRLRPKKGKKSVVVRVWDLCAGCKRNVPHIDLTEAAFKKLYALSVGEVKNIETKRWSQPFKGKWSRKIVSLYGPQKQ